jgi:glycosyltransferase involved in cell wall biosynthesis
MTLIRALPEIKKEIKTVLLLIAGQPFESVKPYMNEIKTLNVEDSVNLMLGYVPIHKIPPLFKAAHIVVLPYNDICQSGIVSSAYIFGKPVVATSVGGLPECVSDGETGFLIPPRNHKALAEAAIRLLKDNHLREKMGNKAISTIEKKFSWNKIAEQTESIYHFLIKSKYQPDSSK